MMIVSGAISLTSPAMLLAAAAVALPIAAHLLNRRTRQRVTFPSIQLLAEAAAGQSRLFQLRRWILLALRCLAIVLIAYAFARPVWVERPAAGGPVGDQQAVVVVIDASASAGQRAGGVNTFARVQAAALGVLDEVRPGRDMANLVVADAHPTAAFPELIPNVNSLRSDIEQLEPTAERADLPAAVSLAAAMLEDVEAQRRIVVVSDMQATNWENVGPATLAPGSAQRPIDMVLVPVGQGEPANVALARPRVQPARPVGNRPVELSVEVVSYSAVEQTASVRVQVDGRERGSRSVTLEPWQGRRVAFGPIALAENEGAGDADDAEGDGRRHRVTFSIGDDALAADNRAYLVVRTMEQASLGLASDADVTDAGREPYFLLRALAPHGNDRDDLAVTMLRPDELAAADLTAHDLVLLSDAGPLEAGDRDALQDFVEGGGGLLVTSSGAAAVERFASLGELSPWEVDSPLALDERGAVRLDGEAWAGDVLDVFDALGRDALTRVGFQRVLRIGELADHADTLLHFDNGEPAIGRADLGEGRVVAANFGAAPGESDLAARGIFVPLVHVMLDAARSPRGGEPRVTVGQHLHLPADAGGAVVRRDPDGEERTGPTRRPGFHTLHRDGELLDIVAVNIDPRESDLRRVSVEELDRRAEGVTDRLRHAGHDGAALHLSGRPLWHYFVLAALAVLALELAMLIAWRR